MERNQRRSINPINRALNSSKPSLKPEIKRNVGMYVLHKYTRKLLIIKILFIFNSYNFTTLGAHAPYVVSYTLNYFDIHSVFAKTYLNHKKRNYSTAGNFDCKFSPYRAIIKWRRRRELQNAPENVNLTPLTNGLLFLYLGIYINESHLNLVEKIIWRAFGIIHCFPLSTARF